MHVAPPRQSATRLAVHGAWLVRGGLVGATVPAEELALAVLVVALGAGGAAMIARARGGSGTLDLGARRAVVSEPAPERSGRSRSPSP